MGLVRVEASSVSLRVYGKLRSSTDVNMRGLAARELPKTARSSKIVQPPTHTSHMRTTVTAAIAVNVPQDGKVRHELAVWQVYYHPPR